MKKNVPVIYEHLFSGMHQILHLKLDNIIQGTDSGITYVKIKTKSLPGQMHEGLAKKVYPFSKVFPSQENRVLTSTEITKNLQGEVTYNSTR